MRDSGRKAYLEETSERLDAAEGMRSKQMKVMWESIQTLENHSKRNNVILIGLKETFGTNGTLLYCVQKILYNYILRIYK